MFGRRGAYAEPVSIGLFWSMVENLVPAGGTGQRPSASLCQKIGLGLVLGNFPVRIVFFAKRVSAMAMTSLMRFISTPMVRIAVRVRFPVFTRANPSQDESMDFETEWPNEDKRTER